MKSKVGDTEKNEQRAAIVAAAIYLLDFQNHGMSSIVAIGRLLGISTGRGELWEGLRGESLLPDLSDVRVHACSQNLMGISLRGLLGPEIVLRPCPRLAFLCKLRRVLCLRRRR